MLYRISMPPALGLDFSDRASLEAANANLTGWHAQEMGVSVMAFPGRTNYRGEGLDVVASSHKLEARMELNMDRGEPLGV